MKRFFLEETWKKKSREWDRTLLRFWKMKKLWKERENGKFVRNSAEILWQREAWRNSDKISLRFGSWTEKVKTLKRESACAEEMDFFFFPFYNSQRFKFYGMKILESERKWLKQARKLFPDRRITDGERQSRAVRGRSW